MPRTNWVRRLSLWAPPLVYAAVIFHLSSQSNPLPQVTAIVWDKALHLIEYAGLALLLVRALAGEGLGWLTTIVVAIAATSAYGASDEWHQLLVPGRDSDYHDWIADTCGGALGVVVYATISRILHRRRQSDRLE